MSYSILHNGKPFMQQHAAELAVFDPKLELEQNKSGMLSFRISPIHRDFDEISLLSSIFEVYDSGDLIYRGRCIQASRDMQNLKTVVAEGMLGWLQDSVCSPFEFSGSLESFLGTVLYWHNAKVRTFQQIQLGTVTVTDDHVHFSSVDYLSSWEILRTRLLDTHGGYFRIRYSSGTAYLDYLADFPNAPVYEVRPTQSLIDLLTADDSEDLYTACIPLGAEILDSTGVSTGERLTVASVNQGNISLVNASLAPTLGTRFAPVELTTWDDVTIAANLLTRGQAWLASHAALSKSITLSAAFPPGLNASAVRLYDKVHIRSLAHDIDVTMLVGRITIDLEASWASRVTLGAVAPTLLDCDILQAEQVSENFGRIEHEYMTVSDAIAIIGNACQVDISNVTSLTQLAALISASSRDPATEIVYVTDSGAVTAELAPNKVYRFTGALTSLTITLGAAQSGTAPHYHFIFATGAVAPTVTLPNAVKMPDGWTVDDKMIYEIDILDGLAACISWPNN